MTANNKEAQLKSPTDMAIGFASLVAAFEFSDTVLKHDHAKFVRMLNVARRFDKDERLDGLLRHAVACREESVFSGKTANETAGSYSETGGLRKYRLKDEHGVEEEFDRPVARRSIDMQSTVRHVTSLETISDASEDLLSGSARAANISLSVEQRLEALREWIVSDADAASVFIATELHRADLESEWCRIVIYAAEAVRFNDAQLRDDIASQLLKHAVRMRHSPLSEDAPVVMSAIRRAGSLVPESRVFEFLPLLTAGSVIDTRLVTLQAIASVFCSRPPNPLSDLHSISVRAVTLAEKHWDKDVFKAGEVSAIAIEATIVAAVLGSDRAVDLVAPALATNRRLLIRKLQKRLQGVLRDWRSVQLGSNSVKLVESMVSHLDVVG